MSKRKSKGPGDGKVRLSELPEDLAGPIHIMQNCVAIIGLLRRGTFDIDLPQHVHQAIGYLTNVVELHDQVARSHPRFAEFFVPTVDVIEQPESEPSMIQPPSPEEQLQVDGFLDAHLRSRSVH